MERVLAGFDVGGTKCAVSTGIEENGTIKLLTREEFKTPVSQQEAATRMCDMARAQAGSAKISGIGISAGNPMDAARGMLMNPPNLPGWTDWSMTDFAAQRLSAPAVMENDANACARAEWRWGAGKGADNMVFITFGTGFGAGLILDGKLYRGRLGNAGELGHWRIAEHGPAGYGKLGSYEGFCSGGGIAQLAATVGERYRQLGLPCAYLDGEISAKTVAEAARKGDKASLEVFSIVATRLGQGLALVIDFLNPDRIVLGSIFARSGDLLEKGMREVLRAECLKDSYALCEIVPAMLGDHIGDYAALALAAGIQGE